MMSGQPGPHERDRGVIAGSPGGGPDRGNDPGTLTTAGFERPSGTDRLRLRCPNCFEYVELPEDAGTNVSCAACGSHFNLAQDAETATFRAGATEFGPFLLLEELGSGHFGTVWKARDTRLERVVALKFPRRRQLPAQDLQLFLREARAAAQLVHPHIVSVHEVGQHQDLVYIASEYVEGADLRQWLTRGRPPLRQAAELCGLVADALEHAHQAGVVHRDLKPANIMIDAAGLPHIMDFGLARRETDDVTVTIDGQILGTPAYMSPEQARGEAHSADRRSDVYSLGVILYELLTGELPFRGERRMLLLQILSDDPVSPRRLNQRVPKDLETICLKCLEKVPDRRYHTAAELAEDLRRWLDHRPIVARPLGRPGKTIRWCRRRPAIAGLLALVVVLTGTGFSLVTWQWRVARTRYVEAEAQRVRADNNLAKLQDAVNQMLVEVGVEQLREVPQMEAVRRRLIEQALPFFEWMAAQQGDDPRLLEQQGMALQRAGMMYGWLGDYDKAQAAYRRAIEVFGGLATPDSSVDPTLLVAGAQSSLARVLATTGQLEAATELALLAVDAYRRLQDGGTPDPRVPLALAQAVNELASLLRNQSRSEEADSLLREAIRVLDAIRLEAPHETQARETAARLRHELALIVAYTPQFRDAEELYRQAIDLLEQSGSRVASRTKALAGLWSDFALYLDFLQRPEEASEARRQALAMRQQLVADFPLVPGYRRDLAVSYENLAWDAANRGDHTASEESFRQALQLGEELVNDHPENVEYRFELADTWNDLSVSLLGQPERIEEASSALKSAAEAWRAMLACDENDPRALHKFGGTLNNLSLVERRRGELELAVELARQAVEYQSRAVRAEPDNTSYQGYLGRHYLQLARLAWDRRDVPQFLASFDKALDLFRGLAERVDSPQILNTYAQVLAEKAYASAQLDLPAEQCLADAEQAHAIQPDDHYCQWVLGLAAYDAGQWERCLAWLSRAADDTQFNRDRRIQAAATLAAAQARLGNPPAARAAVAQARELLGDREPDNATRRRIEETEQLLSEAEPPVSAAD